jgi:muramidase (phage lysozyme)
MSSSPAVIKSPSGRLMRHQAKVTTTPKESSEAKAIRVAQERNERLEENQAYLAHPNVAAYLKAIGAAEGGGYDFKYGAVKGKKNDPWRFTDTSTHPGPGFGGKTTAAGMYQITIDTWRQFGGKMGLTDFSPNTQDLIAVEMLRSIGVIDKIKAGDVAGAMPKAALKWAALPEGPGLANHYPPQPYVEYSEFLAAYKAAGGTGK